MKGKIGDCFKSKKEGFVLRIEERNGTLVNVVIVPGAVHIKGDVLIFTGEQAVEFSDEYFEPYYDLKDYINQL